jgi:hypothetical protein
MALTNRQKNIINPFYSQFEYDWSNVRNQWVLAGIQDTYLNFGFFPEVGLEISAEPGIIPEGDSIKIQDIQAYVSVYPQNARVGNSSLDMLSDNEAINQLNRISSAILNIGGEEAYTSPTSKEAQDPENQAAITGSSGVEHLIDDDLNRADVPFNVSEENLLKQTTSQLISIPYTFSISRRRKIRASFGNPITSLLEPTVSTVEDQNVIPFRGQSDTIDLYNWYNNALPGEASQTYYYNPNDENYYFVKRTNTRNKQTYDLGLLDSSEATRNAIASAKEKGIEEILKLVGKFSSQNFTLIPRNEVEVRTYLNKRPSSRWVYAVIIPKAMIDGDLLEDVAQNESTQDIDFEPYQKAELLIDPDKNTSLRHSTFTLRGLQESIRGTIRVLKDYENIMIAEQITPDVVSGFDIEREILKLETFYDSLSSFFLYNDITTDDDLSNLIEFVFREDMRISYIILDGVLYSKGLGATFLLPSSLVDEEAPLTSQKAVDVFATFGNRTFGFIFNSLLIDNVIGTQNQSERPLWDEFLSTYVIPKIKISPTTQQRKRDRKDFRIAKPPNIFQKIDQLTDNPPPGDLSRMAVSQKDLFYSVTSAMGSCDSVQSTLLKEAFTIYRLINGRAPVWSLTKYAALLVRDELIKEKINQERLNDAIRYAEDPSAIARDAENWVNSEISCITDLIGTAIEDQILKPAGTPKEINKLVTRGIVNPPLRFSFKKGFNSNLWSLWKKQIQLMLIAFIKQLILGVLKDVFKAALGCGPDDPYNAAAGLADSRKGVNYGRIMLNDLIRGIDVVEIATDLNLTNKEVSYNEDKDRRVITSPPRQDQLLQLHRDVSTIVTPTELGKLLDGTASEVLINTIDEMINAGEVDTQALFNERPQIEWDDKIVVSMYQESLSPRRGADPPYDQPDVRYAVLGFDKDNIVNYFGEIGNQLSEGAREALYGEDPITAIQSYCDDREAVPPDLRWEFDLSDVQKQQQMEEAVNSKRLELISLCSMLEGKFNFQLELEDFLDSIPNAGIYDAILRWIADLSNAAAASISDMFNDDDRVPQPRAPAFYQSAFGGELFDQRDKFGLFRRAIPENLLFSGNNGNRAFLSNTAATDGDAFVELGAGVRLMLTPFAEGQPSPVDGRIKLNLFQQDYDYEIMLPDGETETILKAPLEISNLPSQDAPGYSLIPQPELRVNLPEVYPELFNTTLRTFNWSNVDASQNAIKVAANASETLYENISTFYFSPIGRTRLPSTIRSFYQPYFVANDDDCITTPEEAIAKALLGSIEKRVAKFFMNVAPLMRMYLFWNTPDTVRAIGSYMFEKIKKELEEKKLYGVFLQNIDKVEKVFGRVSTQEYEQRQFSNEKIIFTNDMNAEDKFRETIVQSISLVIRRQDTTPYSAINSNFFENIENGYRQMAELMLLQLKENMLNSGDDLISIVGNRGMGGWLYGAAGLPVPQQMVEATDEQKDYILGPGWRENPVNNQAIFDHTPENWFSHDALYYLPVPLFTALQIIMYDKIANIMDRYRKYKFETNSKIAIADDSFLSAVNPTRLPVYSVGYQGFPVFIQGITFYTMEDLENYLAEQQQEAAAGNAAIQRMDEILDEINAQRPELARLALEAQNLVDQAARTAGIADRLVNPAEWLRWIPTLGGVLDQDRQGTNGNIVAIQQWHNYAKRIIKLDIEDMLDTVLEPAAFLGLIGNDRKLTQFQTSGILRDTVKAGRNISRLGEPEEVQNTINDLYTNLMTQFRLYAEYATSVRKLAEENFVEYSYDVIIDTEADANAEARGVEPGDGPRTPDDFRRAVAKENKEVQQIEDLVQSIREQQAAFGDI